IYVTSASDDSLCFMQALNASNQRFLAACVHQLSNAH
uniref:Uncharacterized protein n=1 Tax=Musa acuminata subsp. malaccensis TaxID=214687 RepID=A0A804K9D5_MUSAM